MKYFLYFILINFLSENKAFCSELTDETQNSMNNDIKHIRVSKDCVYNYENFPPFKISIFNKNYSNDDNLGIYLKGLSPSNNQGLFPPDNQDLSQPFSVDNITLVYNQESGEYESAICGVCNEFISDLPSIGGEINLAYKGPQNFMEFYLSYENFCRPNKSICIVKKEDLPQSVLGIRIEFSTMIEDYYPSVVTKYLTKEIVVPSI